MNPLLQLLQALAGGAAGTAGGAPAGLLAGGGTRTGVPTPTPAPRDAAPAGLLGGGAPQPSTAAPITPSNGGGGGLFGGLISKERGADLMAMGANMMQAGAPSTDPRSGDFMNALGSGMNAMQAAGGQRADTDLKRAVTQAQIGNYQSAADQNRAQTGLINSQADANREVSAIYAGMGAGAGAAPATPGAPVQANPAAGGIPQGAIDLLRSNPTHSAAFDEKYGAGSAARVLGGR